MRRDSTNGRPDAAADGGRMPDAPSAGVAVARAAGTVAAAAGACTTMWWIAVAADASPSIAVLTTVIALTLARRTFSSRSEFVRSSLVLPIVGLAAAGVGWLLLHLPLLGALLFVLGMSGPIWMRRFGERA